MALLYGYLFPLIFLAAFAVLYRHEKIPLVRHLGEILTIGVLGGACFGLPTTLVSERERGVWRRYRLLPVPTWILMLNTVLARYLLLLSAGLLQIALAFGLGMTPPAHPLGLLLAFTFVAFAFLGLGLVIAMVADTVPAVQALGQCLFLPMLIIGGVAVPLASLPEWAQNLSRFFPGRYAVDALHANVTGERLDSLQFNLAALMLIGLAACVAAGQLFRWDTGKRALRLVGAAWIGFTLLMWGGVGGLAGLRERETREVTAELPRVAPSMTTVTREVTVEPFRTEQRVVSPWTNLTPGDVATLDFMVPPDDSMVTPIIPLEEADAEIAQQLKRVRADLPSWQPGLEGNEVQRVRNLLCVAAVSDVMQNPMEGFLATVVFEDLGTRYPKDQLIGILTWIALHPGDGTVRTGLEDLGLEVVVYDGARVRERVTIYATKFVMRLTGRPPE